ncbi:hypothetical protein C0Q70_07525 [Pomacea canaliculata]|uniref:Beta-1,4-galactosyltransferase n=1 Tax=Pomacea canaliculata TaxID=400727 RepID=A0A2T7PFB2_POMCA|nr:hypothetical protein C0Q70_07525 [Pomacea canaliculata]
MVCVYSLSSLPSMPSYGDSLWRRRTRLWPTKLQRYVRTRRCRMLLLSAVLLLYLLPLSVRTISHVARTIVISCESDGKSLSFRRSLQFVDREFETRPKPSCLMESSSLMGKVSPPSRHLENYDAGVTVRQNYYRPTGLEGNLTMSEVEATHSDVSSGGEWSPLHCSARDRVAIIIPYRNRLSQLPVLFHYLLPILKQQLLHFQIFLVEQHGDKLFNKGRIMNAGFLEAMKIFPDFRCAVFHDVDLLPEDDRISYSCPDMPRHLSVGVNEFKYKLPYPFLVGGVLNMLAEHFVTVNGYSNQFWGWGGEDDDMASG